MIDVEGLHTTAPPIGVAVIGCGRWGPNVVAHLDALPGAEMRRIIDLDELRIGALRRAHPGVEISTQLDDVLTDDGVSAVVVTTPAATHTDVARRALAGGKHVLVEKPLGTDVAQCEALVHDASGSGLVLMVGHHYLFHPAVRWIKCCLDRGDLGRLCYMTMRRLNLGPVRIDADAAWDLAAHDISIANHWLGRLPLAASARSGAWLNETVADTVDATLRYDGGVEVHIQVSWLYPKKTREVALVGDRRMVLFDELATDTPLTVHESTLRPELDVRQADRFAYQPCVGPVSTPCVPVDDALRLECLHFLDCIRSGEPPLTDARAGLDVVRVLEAITSSARQGGHEVAVSGSRVCA